MVNTAYKLLKYLKKAAAAMDSGSFLPPEPLPNSVKAKQIEEQEMLAEQAGNSGNQLGQMQKAQQDAVNQLQQTQQQLMQVQGELQSAQAVAQQQQQAIQMQADQEIQKAKLDAQYELQSEKIKNQQKLLAMQEKAMRAAGKPTKPDQTNILATQLKRVVKRVSNLKAASSAPFSDVAAGQRTPEQRQQRLQYFASKKNELNKTTEQPTGLPSITGEIGEYWRDPKSYMAYNTHSLGGPLGFLTSSLGGFTTDVNSGISHLAKAVGSGAQGEGGAMLSHLGHSARDLAGGYAGGALTVGGGGFAGAGLKGVARAGLSALKPTLRGTAKSVGLMGATMLPAVAGTDNPGSAGTPAQPSSDYNPGAMQLISSAGGYPGGFSAPAPPQSWDHGLSPAERFSVMNRAVSGQMGLQKGAYTNPAPAKPDIRQFMPKPPPVGEYIPSPVPLMQGGFRQNQFTTDINNPAGNQGYGPLGNFIRNLIFQVGMPMFGLNNPMQPDFSKVYGGLVNNEAYKLRTPNTL